jgi:hypothetical protein
VVIHSVDTQKPRISIQIKRFFRWFHFDVLWNFLISFMVESILFRLRNSYSVLSHCPHFATIIPLKANPSTTLLLVLASRVVLRIRPRRDPWPYFVLSKTFTCFEMGPPLQWEEGSDYYRSHPLFREWLGGTPTYRSTAPASDGQSQSYFTTGGLPQISWSCAKPFEAQDRRLFLQLNPCGHSHYVTSSLTGRWGCLSSK